MSALMTLEGPAATATLQDRLVELVALGRDLQLTPPQLPLLALPSWPCLDCGGIGIARRKAMKHVILAGTTALLMTHGYQIATAIAGAPERPSFAVSGSSFSHHPHHIRPNYFDLKK